MQKKSNKIKQTNKQTYEQKKQKQKQKNMNYALQNELEM